MSIEPIFQEPSKSGGVDEGAPRKSKEAKRPAQHQGIEPRQFVRKAFYVTGVQVTDENMADVAKWCGGVVRTNGEGRKFIKVHTTKAMYDRQTRALPGDWVLKAGKSWKVYTDKAFNEVFEEDLEDDYEVSESGGSAVEEKTEKESDPEITFSPETKAALLMIAKNIQDVAS